MSAGRYSFRRTLQEKELLGAGVTGVQELQELQNKIGIGVHPEQAGDVRQKTNVTNS
jgi:hypothetical protein